jgi:hypothetical protein
MGVQPAYREIDGVIHIMDVQGPCNYLPDPLDGEPKWTLCDTDEFEPQPGVCYCLCGGPPD